MTETFDDVVEEHKRLLGAKALHVSLGQEATPEKLKKELIKVKERLALFESIDPYLRLEAENVYLKDKLDQVKQACRTEMKVWLEEPKELRNFKSQIYRLAEVFGTDIEQAIEYANSKKQFSPAKRSD